MTGLLAGSFVSDVDRYMLAMVDERDGAIVAAARSSVAAGGKRLRPLLVRAARARAVDEDPAARQAFDACSIRAAAAVELVHTASLVHDDVLDGAATRRGEPSVVARGGHTTATGVGDLLFSLAFTALSSCREVLDDAVVTRAVRVLSRAARTLAEGEALQARQAREANLPEDAYFDRCGAKTAVLFSAALQLGAIVSRADIDDVDVLARFGRLVGLAFQVTDDVLDCANADDATDLGKEPGADLRDGTITLPMIHAVRVDESLALTLSSPITPSEVPRVLSRIRATGALDTARRRALDLRRDAEDLLPQLGRRFDDGALLRVAAQSVDRLN